PYGRSRTTLAEAVTVIRELLAGGRVNTTGGDLQAHDVRLALSPVQSKLPIYLAAIGPRALRLVGLLADGVVLNAYTPPGYVRYAVREIQQAARLAGRDPAAIDIACMLVVRLTDDPEALRLSLKPRLVRLLTDAHVGEILLETRRCASRTVAAR